MCIDIRKGKLDIETPEQLSNLLKVEKLYLADGYSSLDIKSCLCQIDVEKTLTEAGIKYEEEEGDFWIST